MVGGTLGLVAQLKRKNSEVTNASYRVALLKQELGQIRSILARNARNQGNLAIV